MIPSLLQIPSAVSDSKLHSVLPNNGKGDFTFDRSTGATRINKDGLIEEVGYFSSELVQNGDFSELGSEALINGDFATDSDWSKGTGWVIMNGYAESDGTNAPLDQVSRLTVGKTYKVVITVTNMTSSALSVRLGTSSSNAVLSILENGTYTAYGVAGATTFRIRSQGFDGRVQNVSVKQVDPNDRWSLGTGWSYGDSKAISDSTVAFQSLTQFSAISNSNGKTFKVKFTISDYQSGGVALYISGFINNSFFIFANGNYEYNLTVSSGTSGNVEFLTHSGGFKGVISNVSIVEVQGDRPRLSYDITNGVVEDQPHLLLENSSTNLITFSEDLNQFPTKSQISVSSNVAISPDGTQNADKLIPNTSNVSTHYIRQDISVSNGVGYVISFFAKKGEYNYVNTYTSAYSTGVSATWDLNAGVVILGGANADIQDFGNGWYRCIWKGTTNSTSLSYRIYVSELEDRDAAFAGDGIKGIYVWGATLEQQAFATSYIKTAGTTITRAAETCNNSKPSVNSTEGVLYAEIAALAVESSVRQLAISDGTAAEAVKILYLNSTQIRIELKTASGTDFVKDITVTTNEFQKIALQYKASNYKLFVNGVEQSVSQTSAVASGLDRINFDRGDGGNDWYGKVKGLAVYNEALSESQLMQLTGVTASSIYSNFVTRTASFTVEALNEVKKVIDNL